MFTHKDGLIQKMLYLPSSEGLLIGGLSFLSMLGGSKCSTTLASFFIELGDDSILKLESLIFLPGFNSLYIRGGGVGGTISLALSLFNELDNVVKHGLSKRPLWSKS